MEADNSYYAKKKKKPITTEYVTKSLGESPEHNHSIPIVLSHHPESFDSIAAWGAEYVLSGHNHGGFIRLPGIGGLIGSDYKLFPKYSAGIYKIKENKEHSSTMLLSRGLGTHTIKFRLFNKPELMVIKFIQKSQP
jgi:predicted MPP superfamily phosphohydrolase